MKKKRIIVFSKNLKIGGMEKALLLLLNQLVKDYQVKLVLEENEGILLKQLSQEIELEEYKLSTSSNVMIRKMKNFIKRFFWQIRNYHKYDFSCNYATYSIIGSKLAQIASKNSSLYIHSNYYDVYHHNKKEIDFF
ncbi:MAG: glycosyltransferase, partial [Bacilli bacterium]|nr:glycosyltransferase [Bacilli bacterium]